MQSLIAVIALCVFVYSLIMAKKCGCNYLAFLRVFVKKLALYIMSFSWIIVITTLFVLACYSNISVLLKDVLSANSVSNIKSLVRLIFGVDSAFVALQMLALYSIMVSFVSCLALSVGLTIRYVYRAVLKVTRATFVDEGQSKEDICQHSMPTFKLYLKYNS